MSGGGSLRPMLEPDLDMVLEWRNSNQVRRFMYSSRLISFPEHRQWFETIMRDQSCHPLIFQLDDVPMGFVKFGPIADGGIADWGFYVAPGAPRGTGRKLGIAALAHAFDVLGLHKICGEVLDVNEASRCFHANLGFRQEGLLVDQHFDGSEYHDVFCFGLTSAEWRNSERTERHADQA